MEEAWFEAETVMFGALDALFAKTGVKPRDIGILLRTCLERTQILTSSWSAPRTLPSTAKIIGELRTQANRGEDEAPPACELDLGSLHLRRHHGSFDLRSEILGRRERRTRVRERMVGVRELGLISGRSWRRLGSSAELSAELATPGFVGGAVGRRSWFFL